MSTPGARCAYRCVVLMSPCPSWSRTSSNDQRQIGAKRAKTVLVDGSPGIQQGHDVGALIPHFAIPPNAMVALNSLTSKHKVMWPVSTVLLQGKPVGTYFWGHVFGVVCARPISLPRGVLVNTECTVVTTATAADLLKALGHILVDAAVDLLWKKLTGASDPWHGSGKHQV